MTTNPRFRRLAAAAGRRLWLSATLDHLGRWLCIGAGLGLVGVVATKLMGLDAMWWLVLTVGILIGIIAGFVRGFADRADELTGAVELDRKLKLNSSIASALEFDHQGATDPFSKLAIDRGAQLADSVRLNQVLPIRIRRSWALWPMLLAGSVSVGLFVPERSQQEIKPKLDQETRQAQAQDDAVAAIEEVQQELASLRQELPADLVEQEFDAIDQIEQELAAAQTSPEEARARTAVELEELSKAIQDQATQQLEASQALQDRLTRSNQDDTPQLDSELARALASGDLEQARQATRKLADHSIDAETAEKLARELRELADQMQEQDQDQGADAQRRPELEKAAEDLLDQGLDPETVSDLLAESDANRVADELEERGIDPNVARRLAEKLAQAQQQNQTRQQAEQDTQDLSKALNEAAEELEKQAKESDPSQSKDNSSTRPESSEQDQADDSGSKNNSAQPEGEKNSESDQKDSKQDGSLQKNSGNDSSASKNDPSGSQKSTDSDSQPKQTKNAQDQSGDQSGEQPSGQVDDREGKPKAGEQSDDGKTSKQGTQPSSGKNDNPAQQKGKSDPSGSPAESGKGDSKQGQQSESQNGSDQQVKGQKQNQQTGTKPGTQQGDKQGEKPGDQLDPDGSLKEQGQDGQPGGKDQALTDSAEKSDSENGQNQQGSGSKSSNDSDRPVGSGQQDASDGDGEGGLRNLEKQLDRLEKRNRNAARDMQNAQKLSEQAQKLMDSATPEQRQRLEQLARKYAKQDSPKSQKTMNDRDLNWQTESLDARSHAQKSSGPASGSQIGTRLSEGQSDQAGILEPYSFAEKLNLANRDRKRAMEQQLIPARYRDLVRRVNQRMAARAKAITPIQDAKDADGK